MQNLLLGRYSIRQLLLITATLGGWFALLGLVPHVAILISGIGLAGVTTQWWLSSRLTKRPLYSRMTMLLWVIFSWAYLYVVSLGPVRVFVKKHQAGNDMIAIYAPVGWLHANTPLREPLQRYSELWN